MSAKLLLGCTDLKPLAAAGELAILHCKDLVVLDELQLIPRDYESSPVMCNLFRS